MRSARSQLHAWGNGLYGQLGHGNTSVHAYAKLVDGLSEYDVDTVVCGERHTAALMSTGEVFTWGVGSEGQLGHGDLRTIYRPKLVESLENHQVIMVACGSRHTAVLTEDGQVFCWGDNSRGQLGTGDFRSSAKPKKVHFMLDNRLVIQIACGAYHTACVADNSVFIWGMGTGGRLGLLTEDDTPMPTVVPELQDKDIRWVGCFSEHTMALTKRLDKKGKVGDSNAKLLTRVHELETQLLRESLRADAAEAKLDQAKMGSLKAEQNETKLKHQVDSLTAERIERFEKIQALEGKLANMATEKEKLEKQLAALIRIPTKLEEVAMQGVRQVSCGSSHVLALCDSGDIYSWGSGGSGQLGLGKTRSYSSPQLVWGMMRKGVRQIGAGDKHSAALTFNGFMYTWGSSSYGQLGHGNRKTQLLPKLVDHLDRECRQRSSTVRLISCGSRHTVAVLGNGNLFVWGQPDFGFLGHTRRGMRTIPEFIEALSGRNIDEGHRGRVILGKAEISELLEQQLNVHDMLRYFPDIESDPEAALYLSKEVATDLQRRVQSLQNQLEEAREDKRTAIEKFQTDLERAFDAKEGEQLELLLVKKTQLEGEVESHEKALLYQTQLSIQLAQELQSLSAQYEREEQGRIDALAQARASDKSALEKMLRQALDGLKQKQVQKEGEMRAAKLQAANSQSLLEKTHQELSTVRVDIKKRERHGHKLQMDHLHELIAFTSSLSHRLSETAIDSVVRSKSHDDQRELLSHEGAGLRKAIELANMEIDHICTQAAEFASDEHVDVMVRQQLATLVFDNAEMRKQLNSYFESILMQSMSKVETRNWRQGNVSSL